MKDSRCLHEIRPGFKFCPLCGMKVVSNEETVPVDSGNYPDGFNPELWGLEERP